MRKLYVLLAVCLAVSCTAFAQKKGPMVDRVTMEVRTQEAEALKDTAAGALDVFQYGVAATALDAFPQDTRDRLDLYTAPAGTWYLVFNPFPNKPPYTAVVGTRTYFNPFAIREVRFAMNLLIDRKHIVDEYLEGAGGPLYTSVPPTQPGAYRYTLLAARLGLTATGDEQQAVRDISDALTRAAGLPDNSGRLVKSGDVWTFDGEPVTVKFLIRVDDPGRLKEGRYVADQIEKAGIKVERLEFDRKKCFAIYQDGNPAAYEWNIYTEAYGSGDTRAWWDDIVTQNYAPRGANMPGGLDRDRWNYENPEIDALTRKVDGGLYTGEKDYWDTVLRAQELGLSEAVRISVCYQDQFFAVNKARLAARMVYGMADGPDGWSLRTAQVKPGKGGEKVLRVAQLSPRGTLFANAWDPVGPDGFADAPAQAVASAVSDGEQFESPVSGLATPWRASWKDVLTKVHIVRDKDGKDALAGDVPVPSEAIQFDPASHGWKRVGPGVTSFSKATYTYRWGKWHDGRPVTIADVLYSYAFVREWMSRDGPEDKSYDPGLEATLRPAAERVRGLVLNKDGTLSAYFDLAHVSRDRVAAWGAPPVGVCANGSGVAVPWEIAEALGKLVTEGGASGTAWSFSADPAFTEVNLVDPTCLSDLTAKLRQMKEERYVPAAVRRWQTAAEAGARYDAAAAWIAAHANGLISNGPFFVDAVDLGANTIELAANRDPSYPYEAGYWNQQLKTRYTRIRSLNIPAMPGRGKEATITARVSLVDWPAGTVRDADTSAGLKLTLLAPPGDKTYKGSFLGAGTFSVTIPAADMDLKPGGYVVIAESALAGGTPSVESATLTVF